MSVSMIENWAIIQGIVDAIAKSQDLNGFDEVHVLVENVAPVEGYPNLIETYLREENKPALPVLMPNEVVVECEIEIGVVVECQVRRAGLDRVFANKDTINVQKPSS